MAAPLHAYTIADIEQGLQIAMQAELDVSMAQQGILPIIHPEAFYSNAADVPDRPVVFAGLQFKVPSSSVGNLPLFTRDLSAGNTCYQYLEQC